MTEWREPPPEPRPDDPDEQPDRDEREPDMSDPEAQRAPGDETGTGELPGQQPPMRAEEADADRIAMDAEGIGYEAVGNDNIREGRVGGVMGAPHASRGQGQGG